MSALSRCFTLASLVLWAHGKGVDRSGQLTASFPNRCVLVRWSQEGNRSYFKRTMRGLYTESHCPHAYSFTVLMDEKGSYVLSWEIRQSSPRKRGYKIFGHKSQELFSNHCPLSYWNRELFCQEGSALSIQSRIFSVKKRTIGEQEWLTCCLSCRRPNSWGRGRKRGEERPL